MTKIIKIEVSTNYCESDETYYYLMNGNISEMEIAILGNSLCYENAIETGSIEQAEEYNEELEFFIYWEIAEETKEEILEKGYEIIVY
ncbi:MAG: hypothetical protein KQ78_01767 [Candidatus Izimaplasma bacterium HR2]|nr:MAG: hypothetical protein KQ78_01767 [Candidatus Izimaplasma bacterium HR2]